MKVVIVTGSRRRHDPLLASSVLSREKPDLVVHGGAVGVDTCAGGWAQRHGIPCLVVTPQLEETGFERNTRMIDFVLREFGDVHDLKVCAFPGEGPGTYQCISVAGSRGLTVETF